MGYRLIGFHRVVPHNLGSALARDLDGLTWSCLTGITNSCTQFIESLGRVALPVISASQSDDNHDEEFNDHSPSARLPPSSAQLF
jgi:hypothetical protein